MGLFDSSHPTKDEIRDQLGHTFYALCLFLAFIVPIPPILTLPLVMAVAFLRELEQHDWDWRKVGKLDLLVFFLATSFFIAAWYMVT